MICRCSNLNDDDNMKSQESDINGMARNEDDEVHITLKQCNRRSKRHAKVLYRPF